MTEEDQSGSSALKKKTALSAEEIARRKQEAYERSLALQIERDRRLEQEKEEAKRR